MNLNNNEKYPAYVLLLILIGINGTLWGIAIWVVLEAFK